jgi:uncharacterized protein (TIGR02246 family)
MNRLLCLSVALIFVAGCSPPTAPTADTGAAAAAIRQRLAESGKDFAAHDFDKVMSFYASDATLFLPGMPMLKGADAIKAAMRDAFGNPNVAVAVRPEDIVVAASGDIAYGYGTGMSTITDPATRAVTTEHSKWVTVFRKQPDGSWQAVADIYNSDGPPAAAKP